MPSPLTRSASSFTSLYRLFLKATSTAVLDHKGATQHLQRLWRTEFESASQAMKALERTSQPESRQLIEKWLHEWNARADRTLDLLYSSSISRGLPHRLTRNLAFFVLGYQQRLNSALNIHWRPSISSDYRQPLGQHRPPNRRKMSFHAMDSTALNVLDEAVKMAEGRTKLLLGRVAPGKKRYKRGSAAF